MRRIDTDSYRILGQKYGLPSKKCGMSDNVNLYNNNMFVPILVLNNAFT